MKQAPVPVYGGILVCSVGVLMQEILLTRIFSFTIWYHLAYLTISTALLGFGAAGSLLAAFPGLHERNPRRVAALCSAGSGLALLVAMACLAPRPLNPDRLLAEPLSFSVGLAGYYLAVTVPFLLAGGAVAIPLAAYPTQVNRLYAADLLGAGLGCAGAVAALSWLDGPAALAVCAALLVGAGALYASGTRLAVALAGLAVLLAASSGSAHRLVEFRPTKSKVLGAALDRPGVEVLATRWSPVNRVDLYRTANSRLSSWWATRGLNPRYRGPLPQALSIQYDGHNGSDVYEVSGPASLRLLDEHLLRTPYLLHQAPRVLVIGVGGGIDVLNAIRRRASHVTGVELQPITIELLNGMLAGWTGGQFQRPEVELVAAEGRHYIRSHENIYDLIQITAVDTFSAQSTGAYVLAESYLYTVEAFGDYLDHLGDDGVVSVVVGDPMYRDPSLPSPLITRLALVAREALERRGAIDPTAHILLAAQRMKAALSRPQNPVSGAILGDLLVKRTPFTAGEVERVRSFLAANGFELAFGPGAAGDPAIAPILRGRGADHERVLAEQAFALDPVTDDRPFFYHVLRWSSLLGGERTLWMFPGSTTGQLMLLAMLGQSLVFGAALILLPLLRGNRAALSRRETSGFLAFFLALGLGFMLIEISFVQKYVLILGYPTYSLSVTIFSLLIFAALGSFLSRLGWRRPGRFVGMLVLATVALVGIEVLLLSIARERMLAASLPVRILVTVLFQLPLGVALGMYFPTGAELLRRREPRLVPWAWAVNGVASVSGSVLAVILGMTVGFSAVAMLAAGTYVAGALALGMALAPGAPADRGSDGGTGAGRTLTRGMLRGGTPAGGLVEG